MVVYFIIGLFSRYFVMKKFISLLVFLSFAIPSVGMEAESERHSPTTSPRLESHEAEVVSSHHPTAFPFDLSDPSTFLSHEHKDDDSSRIPRRRARRSMPEPVESFVEEMPSSGMEAIRLLTRRLQQSLVAKHHENISHYAKPLASLIMEGKLRTKSLTEIDYYSSYGVSSQFPQYGGRYITHIVEGKSYGVSKDRKATDEEREDCYNALSTLAYTSIYAENYDLQNLSSFLNTNIVIEGPELQEDKDNSHIAHRKVVFNYYDGMRRDGKHEGWKRLKFLDLLIDEAVGTTDHENYDSSPYTGVVRVKDESGLESIRDNITWLTKLEEGKSLRHDERYLPLKQKMNEVFKKYFPYFSICSWEKFLEEPHSRFHRGIRGVGGLLLAYQDALSATVEENKKYHGGAAMHGPSLFHLHFDVLNIGRSIETDNFFFANRGYIYETLKDAAIIGAFPVERGMMMHTPTNVFTAFADFETLVREIKNIAGRHVSGTIPLSEQQVIALNTILNTFKEHKGISDNEYGAAFKKRLDHDEDLTILTAMISEEAELYQSASFGSSFGFEKVGKARLKGLGKKFADKVSTLKKVAQSLPEQEEDMSLEQVGDLEMLIRNLGAIKGAFGQIKLSLSSFHRGPSLIEPSDFDRSSSSMPLPLHDSRGYGAPHPYYLSHAFMNSDELVGPELERKDLGSPKSVRSRSHEPFEPRDSVTISPTLHPPTLLRLDSPTGGDVGFSLFDSSPVASPRGAEPLSPSATAEGRSSRAGSVASKHEEDDEE